MTFKELVAVEPQLGELYQEARQVRHRGKDFCANSIWYTCFKPRLVLLVGHKAKHPQLRTAEAYDTAYRTIYGALPNCRSCICG